MEDFGLNGRGPRYDIGNPGSLGDWLRAVAGQDGEGAGQCPQAVAVQALVDLSRSGERVTVVRGQERSNIPSSACLIDHAASS